MSTENLSSTYDLSLLINEVINRQNNQDFSSLIFHQIHLGRKGGKNLLFSPEFANNAQFWNYYYQNEAYIYGSSLEEDAGVKVYLHSLGKSMDDAVLFQKQKHNLSVGKYNFSLKYKCRRSRKARLIFSKDISPFSQADFSLDFELPAEKDEINLSIELKGALRKVYIGICLGEFRRKNEQFGISFRNHTPRQLCYPQQAKAKMASFLEILLDYLITEIKPGQVRFSCKRQGPYCFLTLDTDKKCSEQRLKEFYLERKTDLEDFLQENWMSLEIIQEKGMEGSQLEFGVPVYKRPLENAYWENNPLIAMVLRFQRIEKPDSSLDLEKTLASLDKCQIVDFNQGAADIDQRLSMAPLCPELPLSDFFPDFDKYASRIVHTLLADSGHKELTVDALFSYQHDNQLQQIYIPFFCQVIDRQKDYTDIFFGAQLKNLEYELRLASFQTNTAVLIINQQGRILECDKKAIRTFGLNYNDLVFNKRRVQEVFPAISDFFQYFVEDGLKYTETIVEYLHPLTEQSLNLKFKLEKALGLDNFNHYFVVIENISAQELEKRFIMTHDDLTGFQNKEELIEELHILLKEEEGQFGIFLLSLPQLKQINIEYSFAAGDMLIKDLADSLLSMQDKLKIQPFRVKESAQFAVLIRECSSSAAFRRRIEDCIKNFPLESRDYDKEGWGPINLNLGRMGLHYSIGAIFVDDPADYPQAQDILQKCGAALDEAKKDQSHTALVLFDRRILEEQIREIQLFQEIRRALKDERFEAWFQPIGTPGWYLPLEKLYSIFDRYEAESLQSYLIEANLCSLSQEKLVISPHVPSPEQIFASSRDIDFIINYQERLLALFHENTFIQKITAFEGLLRMRSEEGRIITPDYFVEQAEKNGQIADIEWQLFPKIITTADNWRKKYPDIKVSVNISPVTFQDTDFVRKLLNIIEYMNFPADFLSIEFVERENFMEDMQLVVNKIRQLKKAGINLYSDDFGEGTNSVYKISVLGELLTTIKVSMTFVRNMCYDPLMQNAVKALIQTGKIFDKRVIAEGVETKDTLNSLSLFAPLEIQGYGLSRPIPADQLMDFLQFFNNRDEEQKYQFPIQWSYAPAKIE